jgi:hypothetical protein
MFSVVTINLNAVDELKKTVDSILRWLFNGWIGKLS